MKSKGASAARVVGTYRVGLVGFSTTADDPVEIHAFSWTKTGGIVDLGTLGSTAQLYRRRERRRRGRVARAALPTTRSTMQRSGVFLSQQ
jgi:probable HAF family extracellular repeat protein